MMILIECSADGYELVAESNSKEYLENLRVVKESYGTCFAQDVEMAFAGSEISDIFGEYREEYRDESSNSFEDGNSQFLIVPRSIIGRLDGLSAIEALREKYPLPSMLRQRLAQLTNF